MNKYKNLTLPHDKQGVVVSSNKKKCKSKIRGKCLGEHHAEMWDLNPN